MRLVFKFFIVALCCSAFSLSAADSIVNKPVLTLAGAKLIAEHAVKKANKEKRKVIVAVVDSHGNLTYLERMDGVQLASLDVAVSKAKTSVLYKRSTKLFEDRIKAGDDPATMLPDVMAFAGGLPIVVDGHIVGAIGVSGVRSNQDEEIAQAGIDAFLLDLDK